MRNLHREVQICLQQMEALGLRSSGMISVTLNYKAKKWWYQYCRDDESNKFEIQINARVMAECIPEKSMRSIICGALIHTLPRCYRFCKTWQDTANKLNAAYGYNISRQPIIPEMEVSHSIKKQVVVEKVPEERQLCLSPGDRIHHVRYGEGIVTSAVPMGGDVLLTISFQSVEPIQLMQRAAALTVRKLDLPEADQKGGDSNGQ